MQLDERRQQLLDLGLRLFSERAYDDVSIDDIARAAGISKGLLYHYFPGKRVFYVATVRAAASLLLSRITPDEATRGETTAPERARRGLSEYLSFVENRAGAYRALFSGGTGIDEEVATILEETRQTIINQILFRGLGLESPRAAFRLAARSWIGAVEAACLDWLTQRDLERADLLSMLSQMLIAAMSIAMKMDPDARTAWSEP
ncbi:MAG: helix-turn-helix domain-containing protein [Myxococcota bacterium]